MNRLTDRRTENTNDESNGLIATAPVAGSRPSFQVAAFTAWDFLAFGLATPVAAAVVAHFGIAAAQDSADLLKAMPFGLMLGAVICHVLMGPLPRRGHAVAVLGRCVWRAALPLTLCGWMVVLFGRGGEAAPGLFLAAWAFTVVALALPRLDGVRFGRR